MTPLKRIGILTSGGDCPGLNAAIRILAKKALKDYGCEVLGFNDGYAGLVEDRAAKLQDADVSGILYRGGTILGSSNRANVFKFPVRRRGTVSFADVSDKAVATYKKRKLDALFVIGGDGSLTITRELLEKAPELNVVCLPKTIDNDVKKTDATFGFHSAVQQATEAIDDLHTTAMSHHRIMVVEVMGRYAGWLALHAGVAGGGDVILIPELPYRLDAVCEAIGERDAAGKRASIVVVAEGAKPQGGTVVVRKFVADGSEPRRLGGIGQQLADDIEAHTRLESRVTVLGHLLRSGAPTAYDRLLATRFGSRALELAAEGDFGTMVALAGKRIVARKLTDVVPGMRLVPKTYPLIETAASLGTTFGQ